jgi:hypothetical protein
MFLIVVLRTVAVRAAGFFATGFDGAGVVTFAGAGDFFTVSAGGAVGTGNVNTGSIGSTIAVGFGAGTVVTAGFSTESAVSTWGAVKAETTVSGALFARFPKYLLSVSGIVNSNP